MLYSEIIAVCSQIHTKHINTLCRQNVELLNVKLAVHIVTTGLCKLQFADPLSISRNSQNNDIGCLTLKIALNQRTNASSCRQIQAYLKSVSWGGFQDCKNWSTDLIFELGGAQAHQTTPAAR